MQTSAGEYGFGGEGHAFFEGLVHGAAARNVGQAGSLFVVEVALDEDLAADPVDVAGRFGFAVVAVAGVDPGRARSGPTPSAVPSPCVGSTATL